MSSLETSDDTGCEKLSVPRSTFTTTLRHHILHTTPAFFSINMGTGISSILLHNLPYNAAWLRRIGEIIFCLNVVVFAILLLMTTARYIMWPRVFRVTLEHPLQSMFWGTFPMGMSTIVVSSHRHVCFILIPQNMIAFVCVPQWGIHFARLAQGTWWITVVLSILVNFGVMFALATKHKQTSATMGPAWLLPIVTCVVTAASGAVVAESLLPFDLSAARSILIASYFIWGCGVPLALMVMALYIYRMALIGLPPVPALPSIFLPVGPCGQGAFGIIQFGKVIRLMTYKYNVGFSIAPGSVDPTSAEAIQSMRNVADALYAGGIATGLVLWGLGLFWLVFAVATVIFRTRKNGSAFFAPSKFSIGWWAFTFPIGVFCTATTSLATELNSPAFKVIGTILSLVVVFNWLYIGSMTLIKCCDGALFTAPELAQFEGRAPTQAEYPGLEDKV